MGPETLFYNDQLFEMYCDKYIGLNSAKPAQPAKLIVLEGRSFLAPNSVCLFITNLQAPFMC